MPSIAPTGTTQEPRPTPASTPSSGSWIWWAAAGIALAGAAAYIWRRSARRNGGVDDLAEPDLQTDIEAPPPPETIAQPAPELVHTPDLVVHFAPLSVSLNGTTATIAYACTIANHGSASARKVRMDARLTALAAGSGAFLHAFANESGQPDTAVASTIPPGVETTIRAQVTMPEAGIEAFRAGDRSLFVPLVAFNVMYEWTDDAGLGHAGRNVSSYVVGREAKPPVAKMGAFPLDRGPRAYRDVGQRPHRVEHVA